MRTAIAIVFAGLATPALAEELPEFRKGLWEFQRTVDSGGRPAILTNRKCTSPTDDMKAKNDSMVQAGCKATPLTRSGNAYSFEADCNIQGIALKSKSTITAESDTAYRVEVETTQGGVTTRERLIARRTGDC